MVDADKNRKPHNLRGSTSCVVKRDSSLFLTHDACDQVQAKNISCVQLGVVGAGPMVLYGTCMCCTGIQGSTY